VPIDPSLSQLKLFRDIASTRSVSKGAELSGVSQSAASQMLKALEAGAGVKLLDSSTRPLTVTEPGRLYLDLCRDVLRRQDTFQADLDQLKQDVEGTVRVAAIYSVEVSEMSELEREFSTRQPGARLAVEYLRPEKVYDAVVADRADIGLISYPEQTREVRVIDWRHEEMAVAAPADHALAARVTLTATDLEGLEFIGFDEDLPIRQDIDRYLQERGVSVNVILHFDNLQTLKQAVAETSAISILPARLLRNEVALGRLVAIPLEAPGLFRPLGIIHRKKKRFHPAAQAFLDLLQQAAPA
jgi:DNA-binding transcriptional LysR family regulator